MSGTTNALAWPPTPNALMPYGPPQLTPQQWAQLAATQPPPQPFNPQVPPLYMGPVGSSRVGGDQSLTMPSPNVSPVVGNLGQFPITAQTQADAMRMANNMLQFGPADVAAIRAFHGSPYSFEQFDPSRIGTGEGAQAYGHGLYFAESPGVAQSYRDALAVPTTPQEVAAQYLADAGGNRDAAIATLKDQAKGGFGWSAAEMKNIRDAHDLLTSGADIAPKPPGSMYEVNLQAEPEHFLDWDKPISQQSQHVQDAIGKTGLIDPHPTVEWVGDPALWELHQGGRPTGTMLEDAGDGRTYNEIVNGRPTGSIPKSSVEAWKDLHAQSLRDAYRDPDPTGRDIIKDNPGIEKQLDTLGLPGIKYLDQGSRAAGQGTSNYVVFSPDIIDIIRKYGIAGLIGGGAATAATSGGNQQQEQQ